MKLKTFTILFALAMALSMAAGAFAQDFTETWDENTVLTVFNDLDIYFPDMFADDDSDFLWVDNGPTDFPKEFPKSGDAYNAKAPIEEDTAEMMASFDPCGDGLIKYDVTINKAHAGGIPGTDDSGLYYYGDKNTTYIRDINAELTVEDDCGSETFKLGVKTCESTGGDGCHSVTFRKASVKNAETGQYETVYQAHLKGYLTVPAGLIMADPDEYKCTYTLNMDIDFSTYMTALWPVDNHTTPLYDFGTVHAQAGSENGTLKANLKKDYCQQSLVQYNAFDYDKSFFENPAIRGKYDANTGEARLQIVIANDQPDVRRQNYVIPAEVYAFTGFSSAGGVWKFNNGQRITEYTCKYTVYNAANAAPRTDYCKFGEGIAIPDHSMIRIDITIDALPGDLLRAAGGYPVWFTLRLGGYMGIDYLDKNKGLTPLDNANAIKGVFDPDEFPCPKVSRMQVLDPLKPFMSFYKVLKSDNAIKPSGAYGVYEGGLWGMYQKCGKSAYMMVRLKNDGLDEEIVNLDHTAAAVNGGTPMKWNWVMTTVEPEKGSRIILEPGEEVTLIGRAKLTDIPYQLNADIAMIGTVNFSDFGFYITGKVYSDHNNTRCVAAPK